MAWIKIGTKTTGTNGTVSFDNLPYGNYKFQQTATQTGYTVDTTEYPVTINSAVPVVEDKTNNPTEVGSITINKFAAGYPDFVLAGGQFQLMDSTGRNMLTLSAPTDASGELVFSNLMSITGTPQDYEVLEVVAPTGYEVDPTEQTLSVTVGATTDAPTPNTATNSGQLDIDVTDANYVEYGMENASYDVYVEVL